MRQAEHHPNRIACSIVALAFLIGLSLPGFAPAASKDKVVIYHAGSIDTLNPYAHSLSPAYGIWEHIMEPLVEVDQERMEYVPKLAESWEFEGDKWVFKLREDVKASRRTRTVFRSVSCATSWRSLRPTTIPW